MSNTSQRSLSTQTLCRVCGSVIVQKSTGRFREFCSDNCKDCSKFFTAYKKSLNAIEFQDYSYIKSIRSQLFQLVNSLPKEAYNVL